MKNNIIFIGGIHGVGKGTMCKELSDNLSFKHLSSSNILKWEKISDKSNKKVKNIDSNQIRLINGLNKILKPNEKYLLDGHFCLLNNNNVPEKINKKVFLKIKPIAIILKTEVIQIIKDRLEKRDGKIYDVNLLNEMQNLELNYSKEISEVLKIPHFTISNHNYESIIKFFTKE